MPQSMRLRESDLLKIRMEAYVAWTGIIQEDWDHGPYGDGQLQYMTFKTFMTCHYGSHFTGAIWRAIGESRSGWMSEAQRAKAAAWAAQYAKSTFLEFSKLGLLTEAQKDFLAWHARGQVDAP